MFDQGVVRDGLTDDQLPALVGLLGRVSPTRLADDDLADMVIAAHRVISWATAVQAHAVDVLCQRRVNLDLCLPAEN